ncbi:YncE family protein, partial [Streptomyces collinus]|uniref:YncE family protein n=1 Tax=Streptomyces collinus TaxID=42684 RepID=UPI00378F72B6
MHTTRDECTQIRERRRNQKSKRGRPLRRTWVVGALAALCTALMPSVAPHASADGHSGRQRDTAYVANAGDDTVSVISSTTNQVIATVGVGDSPFGVAVDPPRARAYVTNAVDGTVSVINTRTNRVIATIPVGTNPGAVAVDPSSARAYVTNEPDNTVSVIDTSTNTVIATIPVGTDPAGVA